MNSKIKVEGLPSQCEVLEEVRVILSYLQRRGAFSKSLLPVTNKIGMKVNPCRIEI